MSESKRSMEAVEQIDRIQQEIAEDFSLFEGNKEQSVEYIMDLGMELDPLSEDFKRDEFLIRGCQSKVWLIASKNEGGELIFQSDSNTALTKGLISLLIRVYSGHKPEDIIGSEPWFLEKIGMDQLVGSQRSNGLKAMISRIQEYARSFQNEN